MGQDSNLDRWKFLMRVVNDPHDLHLTSYKVNPKHFSGLAGTWTKKIVGFGWWESSYDSRIASSFWEGHCFVGFLGPLFSEDQHGNHFTVIDDR